MTKKAAHEHVWWVEWSATPQPWITEVTPAGSLNVTVSTRLVPVAASCSCGERRELTDEERNWAANAANR